MGAPPPYARMGFRNGIIRTHYGDVLRDLLVEDGSKRKLLQVPCLLVSTRNVLFRFLTDLKVITR